MSIDLHETIKKFEYEYWNKVSDLYTESYSYDDGQVALGFNLETGEFFTYQTQVNSWERSDHEVEIRRISCKDIMDHDICRVSNIDGDDVENQYRFEYEDDAIYTKNEMVEFAVNRAMENIDENNSKKEDIKDGIELVREKYAAMVEDGRG